jgi:hypothetical protein
VCLGHGKYDTEGSICLHLKDRKCSSLVTSPLKALKMRLIIFLTIVKGRRVS